MGLAQLYAIHTREEAAAYLSHPPAGRPARRMHRLILRHQNRSANAIFGSPDDLKFCLWMTLSNSVRHDEISESAQSAL